MGFYIILLACCLFIISFSKQNNQTILSIKQYFSYNYCLSEFASWNYMFAQGIDINAYKHYGEGYNDHSEVIPTDLDQEDYLIGKKLGNGKFSDVYVGYNKKKNYEKVIIKILRPNKIEKIQREISILTKVNQIENISRFLGVTVDKEYQVPSLIYEYMAGKTLKHQIERLNEIDIRYYSYLLLETIDQAHKVGVIHKDIKAVNIIINHELRKLKLIDWGLSDVYFPDNISYSKIGTICYKAPEILLQEAFYTHFTPAVDVWATGIIMLQMIINKVPLFRSENAYFAMMDIIELFGYKDVIRLSSWYGIPLNQKVYETISDEQEKFTPNGKSFISLLKNGNEKYAHPLGIDLLQKILKIVPTERISAEEALKHPYFDGVREIIKKSKNQEKN